MNSLPSPILQPRQPCIPHLQIFFTLATRQRKDTHYVYCQNQRNHLLHHLHPDHGPAENPPHQGSPGPAADQARQKSGDDDEIIFAIAPSAKQSMSTYGICFAKSAFGTDNAIYVEDLPADLENIAKAKEHVAERIGFAKSTWMKSKPRPPQLWLSSRLTTMPSSPALKFPLRAPRQTTPPLSKQNGRCSPPQQAARP